MRKQDWATKLVEKLSAPAKEFEVLMGTSQEDTKLMRADNAVTLIRERDQHWKRRAKKLLSTVDPDSLSQFGSGYHKALTDLLDAMKAKP